MAEEAPAARGEEEDGAVTPRRWPGSGRAQAAAGAATAGLWSQAQGRAQVRRLDALSAAIRIHRRAEGTLVPTTPGDENSAAAPGPAGGTGGTASGAGSRNGAAARCGCGRRIRVTASVLALGPITCGICGQPFTTPDTKWSPSGCRRPRGPR